jgi:hypothetical protein
VIFGERMKLEANLLAACRSVKWIYWQVKGNRMAQVTFDEVLEAIERLPAEDQADLLEVVRRRLAERGRRRVIEDVVEARNQFSNGAAKPASVDEIMRKINP